jgi:large subunit ribosomal protein L7/L12
MLSLLGSSASRAVRKRLLADSSTRFRAPFHASSCVLLADSPPIIRRRSHELSQEQKDKVEGIFQRILWLDTIQVHLITELINEKMGLHMTPKMRDALRKEVERQLMEEAGEIAETEVKEEEVEAGPKTVDLRLIGFDEKSKIKVIKEVRTISALGLKEAKELVESFPKIIQKGLKPEAAEELKAKLEAAGAQIELV